MSRAPRGGLINSQAWNEVIDRAANGISRDTCDRGPGCAIAGSGHHEVIGLTTTFEPAVFPDDIDFAGAINFGSGQRTRANAAGISMVRDRCSSDGAAPTCATIGGGEG